MEPGLDNLLLFRSLQRIGPGADLGGEQQQLNGLFVIQGELEE